MPKQKMRACVISGYEAMFWRNLKSPPAGYEDIRIFDHFFNWIRYSRGGANLYDPESRATIERMASFKAMIFPSENGFRATPDKQRSAACFQIALRHGCLGIFTTGNYFWMGPLLKNMKHQKDMNYMPVLNLLRSLFSRIGSDFDSESKRTRYYIKEFLVQFKSAHQNSSYALKDLDELSRDRLLFMRNQILDMIRKLNHAL